MKTLSLLAAIALVGLAGCQQENETPKPQPTQEASPDPVKVKIATIEEAMNEIAPADRFAFHQALICEVNRRGDEEAINIDADYIRDLTRRLHADPTLTQC